MFFGSWYDLLRVIVVGTLAYFTLIVWLRVSGKRTLTKMNAFDLVVTVSLGSTLATVLLSKDVSLAEGVLALGLLVFLQYAVAWLSVRFETIDRLVKSDPTLLFYRGRFLDDAMRAQRVTASEVTSAIRAAGIADPAEVEAVVLETAGDMNVLPRRPDDRPADSVRDVRGYPPQTAQGHDAPRQAGPRHGDTRKDDTRPDDKRPDHKPETTGG